MRLNNFLLLLTLLLVPLSGCLGFGDEGEDGHSDECDHHEGADHDACHEGDHSHGNEGNGNETHGGNGGNEGNVSEEPNLLPNATLTMTNAAGEVLDNTKFILKGETITFSAVGSEDPDGIIDLIGLTVVDLNETRTVQLLQDGEFVDITMKFDHVGPVNVTLRVLDNRGEGIQLETSAAVNEKKTFTSSGENLYLPNQSGCQPPTSAGNTPLIDNRFFTAENFNVNKGAKWFSVTSTDTDNVAICVAADDSALSQGATSAETDEGEWLTGPNNYYIAAFPSGPATALSFEVIVHYESKPAA